MDRQIAWVGHTEEGPDGRDVYVVDREGLSRDEICAAFPPTRSGKRYGMQFNRRALIRAIILEAYHEAQEGHKREPKNVRGFWYERLLYTLRTVAGDDSSQDSINSTINRAWGDLIERGEITYAGLNIYSQKSKEYHVAVKEDSPYPTSVVLVEKESFFGALHDIADTYEVSFVATGGQNSRCAAMAYVEQLRALGVDLERPFAVYSFCDFDPEGWAIPQGFIDHLSIKIPGPIRLVRLGVLKEQITDSILQYQATPYSPDAKTKSAKKGALTKYDRFVGETGGIFMPGTDTPARVEIDMYTGEQIRERILRGLAQYIDGFPYQVREIKERIVDIYYDTRMKPHPGETEKRVRDIYRSYYRAISSAKDKLEEEAAARAPEARQRIAEIQREIEQRIAEIEREMGREIGQLREVIKEETADLNDKFLALENLENELPEQCDDDIRRIVDWADVEEPPFGSPDQAFEYIENNGGWRQWAKEVGVEDKGTEGLVDSGRRGARYYWRSGEEDRRNIVEWVRDNLIASVSYYHPDGPDETPEEMIERVMNGD